MSEDTREPKQALPSQEELLKQILQQITTLNVQQKYLAMGPEKVHEFLYSDQIFKMYLPFANIDFIQNFILMRNTFYEFHLLRKAQAMIPPGAIIADVGTNIGNHTVYFSKVCRAERVYSFEPLHETFRILQRNIALNEITNVIATNAAVGERPCRTNLGRYNAVNTGASSFQVGDDGEYAMTSLDTMNLERLDFLKMDVEGGHVAALMGAKETLARCRPIIWVELRKPLNEFPSGEAAMNALGYRFDQSLSPNDHIFLPE
ncbi:methyltransferase, FkbM family [Methylomagnum ishizawai]|uniref:Methyltransferase, FkbM family n=1 Tax=Methylomagnum ishizawai TaxID=1760988 RepID=A0A1Y6D387_9GAMM|nr:FkbM family methyltransferase [Methylomagnum ishizawai]SMF95303.1 methyltransferase, FkbM family [Methylomagnum ishizawai]